MVLEISQNSCRNTWTLKFDNLFRLQGDTATPSVIMTQCIQNRYVTQPYISWKSASDPHGQYKTTFKSDFVSHYETRNFSEAAKPFRIPDNND